MPNLNIPQQKNSPIQKNMLTAETLEKLKFLVAAFSEKLKSMGILVTEDCRIDMDGFRNVYSDQAIEKDKQYISSRQAHFEKKDPQEDIGEAIELLTTIIWNKILGDNLVIVRTSMLDDIAKGVDHLVVEKKTGKVICFIDDVASLDSPTMHKKKDNTPVTRDIKYGFTFKNGEVVLSDLKNIPVFYLGTPGSQLNEIAKELSESITSAPTKREQSLMNFYLGSLALQIVDRALERNSKELLDVIPKTILTEIKKFASKSKSKK